MTSSDQLCFRCGKPARFGYGLPPRPTTWACLGHRALVEATWVAGPYVPLPRLKGGARAAPAATKGQPRLRLGDRLT